MSTDDSSVGKKTATPGSEILLGVALFLTPNFWSAYLQYWYGIFFASDLLYLKLTGTIGILIVVKDIKNDLKQ